jgi:hypothetical protein
MKVTKENAVVGLKVVLDKDSQFAGQGIGAEYGVIVGNETHFPATPKYLWVQVNWIRADGTYISTNYYRIGDGGKFDLNVYEVIPEYVECIKGFNTDLSVNDFNVVGKIYEVEHYNPKTLTLKLKGFHNSISSIKFDGNSEHLVTDYKISDKASFDAQQNPKETLVGRYLKALVSNPVSIGMNIEEYLLITNYNHQDNTYNVTRVRDNRTGFGIEVSHLPKFEVMPVGFNPKTEKPVSAEDDLISEAKRRFPIGTKFIPAHVQIKLDDGMYCVVTNHFYIKADKDGDITAYTDEQQSHSTNSKYGNTNYERVLYDKKLSKWAEIVSEPKTNTSEEFKVGDWVIGWFTSSSSEYYNNAWKIHKIENGYVYPENNHNHNTDITTIRKATPLKIAEAQKDIKTGLEQAYIMGADSSKPSSSPSIYEILHYCKLRYKEGDVVIPLNHRGEADYKEHTLQGEIQKYSNEEIGTGQTPGFLYANGKYAEIVSSSKQEVASKYTTESWSKTPAYSEDCITFVKPKEKYKFSEVEYLLKPINQQLDLPIVKKYKKKSIINL